ncbi:hypothetical protein EYC59_05450 [Candidatus Saccharibacteria bacterium]|nr:MAG: hypothetical protein EYC59_05450 [Candidatus Saccharibacteria bacterium]
MVGSIIHSVDVPAIPYELGDNFGLGLGIEESEGPEVGKYHLYADERTAMYLIRTMTRRLGGSMIGFRDVFKFRAEPSEGYEQVAYVARLSAGHDIVQALTDPSATERTEDAAATLLEQMSDYGSDVLSKVVPQDTCNRLIQTVMENSVEGPRPFVATNGVFADFRPNGHESNLSDKRTWLESHISALSLAFWRDANAFVDLVEYGGATAEQYEEPIQPEEYTLALKAIHRNQSRLMLSVRQQLAMQ